MYLTVILTTGALWLYTAVRLITPLALPLGVRILLALALLAIAQYHALLHLAFGSFAAVELPRPVLILLGWAFGFVLLSAPLLLLRDLAGLPLWLVTHAGAHGWWSSGTSLFVAVLAATLSVWGTWQGVRVPDVKRITITLPNLPAAFDGYRLVQLTDIHANGLLPARWVAAVTAKANALQPDAIVITGDLQDGRPEVRFKDVEPLGGLRARDGVYAIVGNHEYYTDYARWITAFRQIGLHLLLNDHALIRHSSTTLAIAGITDRQAQSFGSPVPDLAQALAGIPAGTPTILLSHRPGNAPASAAAGVALQLSGHTHGGQVLGMHWLTQHFNGGFVSGAYKVGAMTLYVSNGTGLWNGFVLRIGRPSEITLIKLRAAPIAPAQQEQKLSP